MKSPEIRKVFLDFFQSRQHKIVPSAPMVVKNDPTLMFTNAGMNQFKDIFLGNAPSKYLRIADTQKCLRVSGKHNDLEEVGHDTYHHTMFEMLGNWSFGDYFKKEAIDWAWELLTGVYKIDPQNLYATVFGGDEQDKLEPDSESLAYWKQYLPAERILYGSRKDNFWEMGESGPCGPCSEIHVDLRNDEEKLKKPGRELVNASHPQVLEIWNLVFIQYNRLNDASLVNLPQKHVDTGMGFERLCMVLQGKKSNYDTDIFQPIINVLAALSGKKYGDEHLADVAMRVVADHIRAISFAIADGQLPSNTGAGYVIRRILRRAVRYGYTYLDLKEAFMHELVQVLVKEMGTFFPELKSQEALITKVIAEEEQSFLRTLSQGIRRFEQYIQDNEGKGTIDGKFAFELFDTYGFPIDLTRLMAQEAGLQVDMEGFKEGLDAQKSRSRLAAQVDARDWVILKPGAEESEFIGYDRLEAEVEVLKYRKVKAKNQEFFEIVLTSTPFYAESGGQVGDRGYLESEGKKINVIDTYKENDLIIHKTNEIFDTMDGHVKAVVDEKKRISTENNHSSTHLMHAALREVLGKHVEQKGSLVDENHLRFDFSHFSKLSPDEIRKVEQIVNSRIRENINLDEKRNVPFEKAKALGAMALFGEKYGEFVRVITFNPEFSVELCGGTHVPATGQIGFFKILSESAIAAGVRRIEAVTGQKAEEYIYSKEQIIDDIQEVLKNAKDLVRGVKNLAEENKALQKKVEELAQHKIASLKGELLDSAELINGARFIETQPDIDAKTAKELAFELRTATDHLLLLIITKEEQKINLTLMVTDDLIKGRGLHAGNMIREIAAFIKGGGGGQAHLATAGGSDPHGIVPAIERCKQFLIESKER